MAGTEAEHLIGMLDRQRATFRWKAGGLDAGGLSARVGASDLTLGGLLRHLTAIEATRFSWAAFGEDPGEPWRSIDWEAGTRWDFDGAATADPAEMYAAYDDAVGRSRERLARAVAEGGLDQLTRMGWAGEFMSLRRLVCDLVEEYARHTGHADLLREAVDGRVGEDPPEGWVPEGVSGPGPA